MNALPRLHLALLSATLLVCACANEPEKSKDAEPVDAVVPAAPVAATPLVPALSSGVDKANFDRVVRPQDDLYRAVNGAWLARTRIPADKSNYGAFTALGDEAEAQLRVIIEELAALKVVAPNSIEQKVGDAYASFMDDSRIESLGLEPIKAELAAIDALRDRKELLLMMARLYRTGVKVPLAGYVHQDAKDATRYAGDFMQSGLSLPNRDYYLIQDDKFKGLREAFRAHVTRMVMLTGSPDGARVADAVLALETRLAKHQWDKVTLRDPVKRYNPYPVAKLPTLAPQIDWPRYLEAVGFGSLEVVLVSQPSYVTEFGRLLK
ncbi:MAG: hypothetical protein ACREUE_14925, partial [Panacagrimonas sp.]